MNAPLLYLLIACSAVALGAALLIRRALCQT